MTSPALTDHAAAIEQMFCSGNPFDRIVAAGEPDGWSPDDVLAVLKDRGWDLDGSGRLPRSKRITTPAGLRALRTVPAAPPAPRRAPAPPPARPASPPEPAREVTPVPEPISPAAQPKTRKVSHIDHGTPRGYWAELARKVPTCGACRAAITRYTADKKREREELRAAALEGASVHVFAPGDEPVTVEPTPETLAEQLAPVAPLELPPPPGPRVGDPDWMLHAVREHEDRTVRRAAARALVAWSEFRLACEDLADATAGCEAS